LKSGLFVLIAVQAQYLVKEKIVSEDLEEKSSSPTYSSQKQEFVEPSEGMTTMIAVVIRCVDVTTRTKNMIIVFVSIPKRLKTSLKVLSR
jgi:hypothetical protein